MENKKLAIIAVLLAVLAALGLILTGNNPFEQKPSAGAGFREVIIGYEDVLNETVTIENVTKMEAVPMTCGQQITLADGTEKFQEWGCAKEVANITEVINVKMEWVKVPIIEMQAIEEEIPIEEDVEQ